MSDGLTDTDKEKYISDLAAVIESNFDVFANGTQEAADELMGHLEFKKCFDPFEYLEQLLPYIGQKLPVVLWSILHLHDSRVSLVFSLGTFSPKQVDLMLDLLDAENRGVVTEFSFDSDSEATKRQWLYDFVHDECSSDPRSHSEEQCAKILNMFCGRDGIEGLGEVYDPLDPHNESYWTARFVMQAIYKGVFPWSAPPKEHTKDN